MTATPWAGRLAIYLKLLVNFQVVHWRALPCKTSAKGKERRPHLAYHSSFPRESKPSVNVPQKHNQNLEIGRGPANFPIRAKSFLRRAVVSEPGPARSSETLPAESTRPFLKPRDLWLKNISARGKSKRHSRTPRGRPPKPKRGSPVGESSVEKAWRRREQAGKSFDKLCTELRVPVTAKGILSHAGHTLLLKRESGVSDSELLLWVEENYGWYFRTEEERQSELTRIIAEDRGWPHRSFMYLSRVYPKPPKRVNPQHYFLGLGSKLKAVQEGNDPDRYVPDTKQDVVTLVGRHFDGPRIFEMQLTEELTVAEGVKAVSESWHCNPANTTIGYHGRPFADVGRKLVDLGVVLGTVLHAMPGWATVEEMEAARRSLATAAPPS